jgi:cytochrome c oxidase subunit II
MSEANIEGNAGAASSTRQEPHHMRRVLAIWIISSLVVIAIWLATSQFILSAPGSALDNIDNISISVFTVLSIPVAMFVFVFLAYSLLVFRSKGRPTEDGIPLYPKTGLQIGWIGITSVLCLFLVIWGLFAFYQETSAATTSDTLVVNVTAQQWMFTIEYPQYGMSSKGAQMIELPVNRPVIFHVTSLDVLHGFAVRALGVRVDANPGYWTSTPIVTPTQLGPDVVQCVELCGLYHSYMWESINVVSADTFNAWILSQGGHS